MLSDNGIKYAIRQERLSITPFTDRNLNPASYDVTLGSEFLRYYNPANRVVNPYEDNSDLFHYSNSPSGVKLEPGEFMLASTVERVRLSKFIAASVSGKSSLARLGVTVHVTAGWIDPGFDGQVTLELHTQVPVVLFPGMTIAQLCFEEVPGGALEPYKGRYAGQRGPVVSKYGEGRRNPLAVD